ncbi:hypothetical protein H671_6g16050 [Cricetulus griseus]|nr:hypothetical protein H671_6g16050 [Cricetulus griseus]
MSKGWRQFCFPILRGQLTASRVSSIVLPSTQDQLPRDATAHNELDSSTSSSSQEKMENSAMFGDIHTPVVYCTGFVSLEVGFDIRKIRCTAYLEIILGDCGREVETQTQSSLACFMMILILDKCVEHKKENEDDRRVKTINVERN